MIEDRTDEIYIFKGSLRVLCEELTKERQEQKQGNYLGGFYNTLKGHDDGLNQGNTSRGSEKCLDFRCILNK